MANTGVPITAGAGTSIAVNLVGGLNYQVMKLDVGADGVSKPVFAGGADGLPVDLLSSPATGIYIRPAAAQTFPVSIAATVNIAAPSPITVAAVVASPVFVRLSDGTNPIATLPVSGTITANQGTANTAANAWFNKITDGVDTVGISTVGGAKAIKVDVIQSVGATAAIADEAAFTAGASIVTPIAAVFNDAIAAPAAGQAGALRMTQLRGLHINIRKNDGTELGIAATPLRTDPTGTTAQPVTQSVADWTINVTKFGGAAIVAVAAGVPKIGIADGSGNAYTDANPMLHVPALLGGRTRVTKSVSLTGAVTGGTVWTPAAGKKFVITAAFMLVSVTGALTLFDGTNVAGNLITDGVSGAWTVGRHDLNLNGIPWPSSTADNVLKYTSGAGFTAVLTVHGYEV